MKKKVFAPLLALAVLGCTSVSAHAETIDSVGATGNGPYFVGAGIAVLVFIGVVVFCKFKGNQ